MELKKEWVKGTMAPLILKLLASDEMYGYEMSQRVNARTNGALEWKEGTLYPWLHRLEAEGLLTSEWKMSPNGKPRKYYRITRKGRTVSAEQTARWAAFSGAVNTLMLGA